METDANWIRISTEDFYKTIGQLNVHPRIVNDKYPYTSEFITSERQVCGKCIGVVNRGVHENHYYVPKNV